MSVLIAALAMGFGLSQVPQGAADGGAAPALSADSFAGFPALSQDRALVAVVDTEYRDGYDSEPRPATLKLISRRTGKTVKQVELRLGGAHLGKEWRANLETARTWLSTGGYQSLAKVEPRQGPISWVYDRPALSVLDGKKLLLKTRLPDSRRQDPVCLTETTARSPDTCTVVQAAQFGSLWADRASRVLVVEYGYYEGSDGQEQGPDYLVFGY